ncbi:transketolase [Bdellovibrio sp. HCB337]|uniref:transketolase n=1 Tax=Bdellovibrio sp. HCB337 TaxID=3394358 RepID=UPI0039A4E899
MNSAVFDAKKLRKTVLDMAFNGSTVHIPCAFSLVEILAVLYRNHLNLASGPKDENRDFLILSKGHGVMAQYACLFELGWLTDSDVKKYFADGTRLKGLSDSHVEGLEVTSGSLGHGLSVGAGIALGCKLKKTNQQVYAIVGDGESNEGSIWEALLFAAHWKLDNLCVIIDANGFQAMGPTNEVMHLSDLGKKMEAFDFDTIVLDGHDEAALHAAFSELKSKKNGRPKAVVANTVKGKGVSFMEGNNVWHYTRLNPTTYQEALKELGF